MSKPKHDRNDAQRAAIIDRLRTVRDLLKQQSVFSEDSQAWASGCLTEFIEERVATLDHAFGLKSSKRGTRPVDGNSTHAEWVADAFLEYLVADRSRESDTQIAARIGRKNLLKAGDGDDRAVASEFKRTLIRYRSVIAEQIGKRLAERIMR